MCLCLCVCLCVYVSVCVSVCLCVFLAVGGECSVAANTSSGLEGWWQGKSSILTSLSQCRAYDRPAGLHFIKYRTPADFSRPDEVFTGMPQLLTLSIYLSSSSSSSL